MEENFSMDGKIFGMEWKWNGRKLPVWKMEKSSSIPFRTMPCLLDWLHSYQLLIDVFAVDQCQHPQKNYSFCVSI